MINLLEAFKNETRFTKKIFGQHFLTNKHLLNEIVDAANIEKDDNIIEIGPGCGVLTQLLAKKDVNITAIEIDTELVEFLSRYLFFYNKLNIVNEDVTKINFENIYPNKSITFIGNLPYNLSVKIFEQVALFQGNIKYAVFMFQKEVADRLSAKPNSKNYSSLSVFTSYFFDTKKVKDISGGNFWPNAKVFSTILKFTPKKKRALPINEEPLFFEFIKSAFVQKRKILKNNLKSIENIDNLLIKANIKERCRAEELSLEEFINLFKVIYAK